MLSLARGLALEPRLIMVDEPSEGLMPINVDLIAAALRRALTEPGLSERMSRRAAGIAPQLLWPAVASRYRELAATLTRIPAGATL